MDIQVTQSAARPAPREAEPSEPAPAGAFTARVVESLRGLSDAELDRVTEGASVFFGRRWFRLLDALDLSPLVRSPIELRYVVVSSGAEVVAICPFFLAQSASIHASYSFEKAFFSSWQEDLLRIDPMRTSFVLWVSRLVEAYRRAVNLVGARTGAFLLAMSPLSYRGSIAVTPLSASDRDAALGAAIEALQGVSSDQGAPIWFYRIPGEEGDLRTALAARGFHEIFMLYDNLLDGLDGGLDGYLARFKGHRRKSLKREIGEAKKAGVRFEIERDLGGREHDLERLYEATYSKYGSDHLAHPAPFWPAVMRHLGPEAEALLAYRGDQLIGFSMLLHRRGDLWVFRIGKSYDKDEAGGFLYFNLVFYEPIRRAEALGARRIWLGAGGWSTKHHRGAIGAPIHGAFWFPSRRARGLLLPYLDLFAHMTRRTLEFSTKVTANAKATS